MTRESRILLVVGLLAALGVASLLLIADRYRRLLPTGSRPPARQEEIPADLRAAAAAEAVERFLAVRAVVSRAVDTNRHALLAASDPRTGEVRGDVPEAVREAYRRAGAEVGRRKAVELGRVGMTEREYDRLRLAYLAWGGAAADLDPALRAAFETRRARIAPLGLGAFERLDGSGRGAD